jgi:hypothetical protein
VSVGATDWLVEEDLTLFFVLCVCEGLPWVFNDGVEEETEEDMPRAVETADDAEVKTGIGAEEVVLATEEIDDGARVGSDAGTEDDMLVDSGATEDVDTDADAEAGLERLKAVVLLSNFSTRLKWKQLWPWKRSGSGFCAHRKRLGRCCGS